MSYVTRWLFSTSHKDIGILYLIYGMVSAMVATAMSVIIRLELSGPGPMFLHGNNQVFNVLVTGHALAMIFLFVMPILIGSFGNYFLPIMIGAVDMAFARLNNISFWCLPPALVCVIASVLIETGAGTGWTVIIKLFQKISFDAWKTLFKYIKYIIRYSYINTVIMLIIERGSHACTPDLWSGLHQRLNMIIHIKYKSRVNNRNNIINKEEWLVGLTDGIGGFNIDITPHGIEDPVRVPPVKFSYILNVPIHNIQLLYKIKSLLGSGNIIKDKYKCKYIISNNKHLINIIIPIFDKYPLLTNKYNRYRVFRESIILYKDENWSIGDRISRIQALSKASSAYAEEASPVWSLVNPNSLSHINLILSKSWLIGFIETQANLSIINKNNKLVHKFSISINSDPIILIALKRIFHIRASVKYGNGLYSLDTTNNRSIHNIIQYFITRDHTILFLGMINLEFSIWKRSYYKYKNKPMALAKAQSLILKLHKPDDTLTKD